MVWGVSREAAGENHSLLRRSTEESCCKVCDYVAALFHLFCIPSEETQRECCILCDRCFTDKRHTPKPGAHPIGSDARYGHYEHDSN